MVMEIHFLKWCEPWQGLNENGEDVICNVTMLASEADCVNIQRYHCRHHKGVHTDESLLADFMAVNWIE